MHLSGIFIFSVRDVGYLGPVEKRDFFLTKNVIRNHKKREKV